jgi:cell division protein FtsN
MRTSATPNTKPSKLSLFWANPFLAGIAVGLLAAAILALYITQSSLPFVDRLGTKPSQSGTKALPSAVDPDSIDPNKGLASKDAGMTESASEAGITPADNKMVSPTGMTYLIQVGAFKAAEDADQMKARMAILGFEAAVSETQREGTTLFRVRLGPYASIDELNRVRARVSEGGIESSVVRVNLGEPSR